MTPSPFEIMDEATEDCPLCLTSLESFDHKHPIQCTSHHCTFNFCLDCIESLIRSTKDTVHASDDNVFSVLLHCPNCRSDLGPTIRDTLLLRKVDKKLQCIVDTDGHVVKEDELSASQIRFKHGIEKDVNIASAIEAAQKREMQYIRSQSDFQDQFVDIGLDVLEKKGELWSSFLDDEEGFEADIDGNTMSFMCRHKSFMQLEQERGGDHGMEDELANVKPDKTLFSGLEAFMTDQEKQYITYLLTTGSPNNLAAATELLDRVAHLSRLGQYPCMKRVNSMHGSVRIRRSLLQSIRDVIKDANEEKEKDTLAHRFGQLQMGTTREQKLLNDLEIKRETRYMTEHPLPARMPKYAELTANDPKLFALSVVDDVWDGSVQDAFSRIIVNKSLLGGKIQIKKQYAETPGIRRIIDANSAKHNGKGIIDIERPRVVVSSVAKEAGMQGVLSGDVVSHINGDEFLGTADDLRGLIGETVDGTTMTFAFNADQAVAEALRRRSLNFEG